jgi:putative CocE/NonD family hydrolase
VKLSEAHVFETGTNVWRAYNAWPPPGATSRRLYFHAGGRLSFEAPSGDGELYDEYLSDPARPVPYTDVFATGMTREHMIGDQRFASTRPDVLTYRSDVLEEDVTFAGAIRAALQVSTTGTDSDWIVKLIDVYPDEFGDPEPSQRPAPRPGAAPQPPPDPYPMGGFQQLVRGEVLRGKFRNSFEKPEPFEPGKRTPVEYTLNDIFHTFRRGHRIMVQIQSTWFPLVDRNPQKFCDIYAATEADFQKAIQRVYRSRTAASYLQVGVLKP